MAPDCSAAAPPPSRRGAWPVDEPLPMVLRDQHLMRVLDLSPASFYRAKKEGRFRALEVKRAFTRTTRYSTALVQRYVDGLSLSAFGRGRRDIQAARGATQTQTEDARVLEIARESADPIGMPALVDATKAGGYQTRVSVVRLVDAGLLAIVGDGPKRRYAAVTKGGRR